MVRGISLRNGKLHTVAIGLVAVMAYYVFFQLFYNEIAFNEPLPYQNSMDMLRGMGLNFIPILLTFVTAWLVVHNLPVKGIGRKIMADAIVCLAGLVFINELYTLVVSRLSGSELGHVDWAGTIFNLVIILLGVETAFYVSHFKEQIHAVEEQRRMTLQYRYDALRLQVRPHFLFNSLNLLYALIGEDDEKARQFTIHLSQTYRYVVSHQDEETVLVTDELEFLSAYTSVLSTRYNEAFVVCINGRERVSHQRMVPFTMQLLIENVVKHNVVSSRNPMQVDVVITEDHLSVSNPIRKKVSDTSTGKGLSYLKTLYEHHGRQLTIEQKDNRYTVLVPFI